MYRYPHAMVVSVSIARRLRDAGARWEPQRFDFFHIPDRNLDDEIFVITSFGVNVQHLADGIAAIAFEGAVEWSLDYILTQDVIWLPTETQAREMLGDAFIKLDRLGELHRVTIRHRGESLSFESSSAADAYGLAAARLLSE